LNQDENEEDATNAEHEGNENEEDEGNAEQWLFVISTSEAWPRSEQVA
jgi:hypothetical protein